MSAQQPKDEMSFLDHLEELRWHLIRSVIAILIVAIVAFIFKDFIFDVLLFGPKQKDFITYRWFCSISQTLGQGNSFCIDELPFRIQSRTMAGQFSAHLWTSILAGFILAFPYIIFEFWKFISPGLYEKERKNARGFIFIASMLFFIGVLFGYYIVTPLSINFLGNYSVSSEIFNDFDLRKNRKISLVVVLSLSAIITPPDIASQIIVSIPILVLYEVSILISRIVTSRQNEVLKNK